MKTNQTYDEFIINKNRSHIASGFNPRPITAPLFDWQAHVVKWACRTGKAALFEDCGLGKTLQQLEWAHQVVMETSGMVIILTPLAVAHQTQNEARKFGIDAVVVSSMADIDLMPGRKSGIFITNYEKLDHFDCSAFVGVVLDESSILKNFTGKLRKKLTDSFSKTPYRLCCTATPSPNDYTEFGQHADFLGICTPAQMLSTFFINDTFNTGDWRLKKHADTHFWAWVASWAACVSKPSDIGYSDEGYILPPLNMQSITVDVDWTENAPEGELIRFPTMSATTMHQEMRMTSLGRAEKVAALVNNSKDCWIVWCNTNDESEKLAKLIPDSVQVKGSDTSNFKQSAISWFLGEKLSEKELKLIGREIELAACGNQNTPPPEKPSINLTHRNASGENLNAGLQKKMQHTCASIMPHVKKDGTIEQESNGTQLTPLNGKNISQIQNYEKNASGQHLNGSRQTQKSENHKGLNDMELDSANSTICLKDKKDNAPSADMTTSQSQHISHSLTTATNQGQSGDCFACLATKDSVNLETTHNYCSAQSNTSKRVLISKSSIFGYGLNFQHCRNVAFVGLSYSFEDFYQALRRSYRFGQTEQVNAYIVQAATEGNIIRTINQKIAKHKEMQERMKIAAAAFVEQERKQYRMKTDINTATGDGWEIHHGDCVRVAKTIEDESIDFSIFSPPFADLFTYSDDLQDMGNCSDMDEFRQHFEILIEELARIMKPGREVAVHCVDLLSTKSKHGKIEFQDFSGEIIRMFWKHGFLFHSRICIWKSPVTEMQRTKAHGLLYKTLKADSCDSRVGCADYLIVFRKPGENPNPVTKDPDKYPVDWWQEVASPVWMTVDQGRVLSKEGARDHADERHICCLQLDVVERAIELWSNEGDLVYSPFMGVGSEGYGALNLNRRFVGSELKDSYFNQSVQNLKNAKAQLTLF